MLQLLAQGQVRAGSDVHVAIVVGHASPAHPLVESLRAGGVTPHLITLPGRAYLRERAAILERPASAACSVPRSATAVVSAEVMP